MTRTGLQGGYPGGLDALSLCSAYASGALTPVRLMNALFDRIEARGEDPVWIHRFSREQGIEAAHALELRREAAGGSAADMPLYGLPFAVKDNIDAESLPTTAACPGFAYQPRQSALVVQRLQEAGALLVGKTNLDQFAAGLVGIRTPYGAIPNPFNPRYLPGGSSSGSAVAVASGLVSFALGTDTAGSGRVPAAFNNIVGLKPTRGLLSCSGTVPACRSLDCLSVFALTCSDAQAVFSVACAYDPLDPFSRMDAAAPASAMDQAEPGALEFRFGVPPREQLEFYGDGETEKVYLEALERLEALGGTRVEVDFRPFRKAARMLYEGPFVAERLEAPATLLSTRPQAFHPATRSVLEGARRHSALDLFLGLQELRELIRHAAGEWTRMDCLALPTAPTIYTIDQVEADPFELNARLGYYTNFVNLLDTCALALPAGFREDGLPAGLCLVAPALQDDWLCALGSRFQKHSALPLGATGMPYPEDLDLSDVPVFPHQFPIQGGLS